MGLKNKTFHEVVGIVQELKSRYVKHFGGSKGENFTAIISCIIVEKETGSQWTHSIIREEATESDLRLQKAREKIPKVEERFSHQGEQWRNLLNATNTELTAPKGARG